MKNSIAMSNGLPSKRGLYDPFFEHEACGVGFVVNVQGRKSHQVIQQGLEVLRNLDHRGACGCEANTGDGAGILLQTPHEFFAAQCEDLKIHLPAPGEYGVGMLFLPTDAADRQACEREFERIVLEEGQTVLGWRDVPTNDSPIGPTAKASEPIVRQVFVGRNGSFADDLAFERKLYMIRRRATKAVKRSDIRERGMFYISSLSYKTIVYKG